MTEPADLDSGSADRVLVIERVFDAPRELIFRLWTDPDHVRHWFGPRGFEATFFEMDARAGGQWRGGMREAATGKELTLGGVCREVVPPERLVFTTRWDEEQGGHPAVETLVEITLKEEPGGRTRMIFRQGVFDTVEDRDGHEQGWTSSFEKLAEYTRSAEETAR